MVVTSHQLRRRFRRKGTRRGGIRKMVATAKRKRFENRVRAIAAGPQETKWAYGRVQPFTTLPPGVATTNFVWIFNPFSHVFRSDTTAVRSRSEVLGEEFILRGLKMSGYVASNVNRVMMTRLTLISTDQLLNDDSDGDLQISVSTGNGVFDDEGVLQATLTKFDTQKVRVLKSTRRILQPAAAGNGTVWRINSFYKMNQKKMAREQEPTVLGNTVGYLKNRQYYWVMEIHFPGVGSVDYNPGFGSELASYVYWKDP